MHVKCKELEKNYTRKVAWYQARKYTRKLARNVAMQFARKEQLRKSARTYATKYAMKGRKEQGQKGRTDLCKRNKKEKRQKIRVKSRTKIGSRYRELGRKYPKNNQELGKKFGSTRKEQNQNVLTKSSNEVCPNVSGKGAMSQNVLKKLCTERGKQIGKEVNYKGIYWYAKKNYQGAGEYSMPKKQMVTRQGRLLNKLQGTRQQNTQKWE